MLTRSDVIGNLFCPSSSINVFWKLYFCTQLEVCIVVFTSIVAHKKNVVLGGGGYQHFGRTSYLYLWGTLNKDALCSCKTLVPIYQTWCHNLEDQSSNLDYLETSNLMSWSLYISLMLFLRVSKTVQSYYTVRSIMLTLTWSSRTNFPSSVLKMFLTMGIRGLSSIRLHFFPW
jgi:hypothetical protein